MKIAPGLQFASIMIVSLFVTFSTATTSYASEVGGKCWTPSQLLSRPEEKSIKKTAYNTSVEPQGPNIHYAPVDPSLRGSIRRVELSGNAKLVALTFDLCENGNEISGYDGQIVDTLRAANAKATFFASGKWLLDHDQRAEQLLDDPLFEVGAHSWTHRNFRLLDIADIQNDISLNLKADRMMREKLSAQSCAAPSNVKQSKKAPVFRFPFGTCKADSLEAVNDAGMVAIQWDVVSADPAPGQSAHAIYKAVLNTVKPGSIVVMHGNGRGWHTAEAIPQIIQDLRKKGFEFATVSELLSKGRPVVANSCYEAKPGDNIKYDKLFPLSRNVQPKPMTTNTTPSQMSAPSNRSF